MFRFTLDSIFRSFQLDGCLILSTRWKIWLTKNMVLKNGLKSILKSTFFKCSYWFGIWLGQVHAAKKRFLEVIELYGSFTGALQSSRELCVVQGSFIKLKGALCGLMELFRSDPRNKFPPNLVIPLLWHSALVLAELCSSALQLMGCRLSQCSKWRPLPWLCWKRKTLMKVLTKLRNTFNTENGKIGPQYDWVNYKTV